MRKFKINKNYLLLKNWWESIDLTNYEKSFFNRDIILFVVSGDINRNEVSEISSFIKDGKKIFIVVNKIDLLKKNELEEIIENINFKLPKDLNIPIIINQKNNLENYLTKTINLYGEILLILNSLQLADKFFFQIKEQRLKRRQKLAQSTIGKFSTIKASAVALNPFIFFDIAGSIAIDTALISELSKIYGLNLKGESTRKLFKNISMNNLFLGVTQVGINTSFNLVKKVILLTVPFTNGLSLLPYGPIAVIQAVLAVHSTKILGKLAAKEILNRGKVSFIEPSIMIQNIIFKEPEIFNHVNIYLSNRNFNKNFVSFLP